LESSPINVGREPLVRLRVSAMSALEIPAVRSIVVQVSAGGNARCRASPHRGRSREDRKCIL